MVSLSQLEQERARSRAGMDTDNIIVNPKVLRKALLKVFYADSVNEIMKITGTCHMKEPEPKKIKHKKGEPYIIEQSDLSNLKFNDIVDLN